MKNELATRAVAIAWLARSGFRPSGDLLLIAEADEESGTDRVGMPWLVEARPDLRVAYAINEGAAERLQLADGRTAVTINVGEKGALAATITAVGEAGPASLPWAGRNAVGLLATLIERLSHHDPAPRLIPQTDAMLTALVGPGGSLEERIERACALHPMLPDLIRPLFVTTIAPTRLHGSTALNVMPRRGVGRVRLPPHPRHPLEDVGSELRAVLGDDIPYRIELSGEPEGGSISPLQTPLYDVCRDWVAANDPGAIFIPTICNGFTNSHYLREAFGTVAYGSGRSGTPRPRCCTAACTAATSACTPQTSATRPASTSRRAWSSAAAAAVNIKCLAPFIHPRPPLPPGP